MATKKKATKTTAKKAAPKKKKKAVKARNPEWLENPPVPEVPGIIDLAKPSGCVRLRNYCLSWRDTNQTGRTNKTPAHFEPHRYHSDVARFAEKFQPPVLCHREDKVLVTDGMLFLLRNKQLLYWFSESTQGLMVEADPMSTKEVPGRIPSAVLLTQCEARHATTKDHAHLWLVNGDDAASANLNNAPGMENYPTISFACLAQFYGEKATIAKVMDRVATGEIKVIDYTPDEKRPLTAAQKKVASRKNGYLKLSPPEAGFELIGTGAGAQWHRSGTVLLEDTKTSASRTGAGNMHMLLGVDEGSYFGCELPCEAASIEEAYQHLIPEEIMGRGDCVRQGEWYIVPVEKEEVPPLEDCVLQWEQQAAGYYSGNTNTFAFLPVETPESNRHIIYTSDGRVSKDGKVYALDPVLHHDEEQHEDAECSGWATFVKNAAVRSFSQGGVD